MDSVTLHEKVLYPVVRVRAGQAGGSGVLVYSEPDPKEEGKFIRKYRRKKAFSNLLKLLEILNLRFPQK